MFAFVFRGRWNQVWFLEITDWTLNLQVSDWSISLVIAVFWCNYYHVSLWYFVVSSCVLLDKKLELEADIGAVELQ